MITGKQIREAREKKGLSRGQLAHNLGIHPMSVYQAEKGHRTTASKVIIKAFGLTEAPSNGQSADPLAEHKAKLAAEVAEHNATVQKAIDQDEADEMDGIIPGGLLKVSREAVLTVPQMLTLARLMGVLRDAKPDLPVPTVVEWRKLRDDVGDWL